MSNRAATLSQPRMNTQSTHPNQVDRSALRLAAGLQLFGALVYLISGILHPAREDANNHTAVFAEYAASTQWTAVHLGQFIGMAIIIAGLLVLYFALNLRTGMAAWIWRIGAMFAIVVLALYGVLQAVDGVALKHAVDAWANAPAADKPFRFASAETVRWLEWGTRSYESFVFGVTLLLFGVTIAWSARVSRVIGGLMILTGLAYIVQGLVIGADGFSAANSIPTLTGYATWLIWSIWLLVVAWRMRSSAGQGALA